MYPRFPNNFNSEREVEDGRRSPFIPPPPFQQQQFQQQMHLQQAELEKYQNLRWQREMQNQSWQQHQMIGNKSVEIQRRDNDIKSEPSTSGRWTEKQTKTLVLKWKDNITELESSRNRQAWLKIMEEVNKQGSKKTPSQGKKKLSNLKDTYKKAKENNKKTGAAPDFPPYYGDFDEILSGRPVVELDLVQEVGVSITETERELSEDFDLNGSGSTADSTGDVADFGTGEKLQLPVKHKRRSEEEPDNNAKKAKKQKETFKDKFLEMQERQMEAFKESDQQNREFLVKLEEQQQKAAVEEKQRDRDFFMQLATLLAKK